MIQPEIRNFFVEEVKETVLGLADVAELLVRDLDNETESVAAYRTVVAEVLGRDDVLVRTVAKLRETEGSDFPLSELIKAFDDEQVLLEKFEDLSENDSTSVQVFANHKFTTVVQELLAISEDLHQASLQQGLFVLSRNDEELEALIRPAF